MKEIGGYFELELNRFKEFHNNAIRLNLGRTAFEYILTEKRITKVLIPFYTCEVLLEPIRRRGIDFDYYHIDENFEPIYDFTKIGKTEFILYTNYFGLKDRYIEILSNKIGNLIIDNSQAFFSKPISGISTFYSLRKFFGVPDGAYLYSDINAGNISTTDISINRMEHLLGRLEKNAEDYYEVFKKNDEALSGQPIKRMSNVTHRLLMNIDYKTAIERRRRNFEFLQNWLYEKNLLRWEHNVDLVPMVYPFITSSKNLRDRLIEGKIFVPTYWESVKRLVGKETVEYRFVNDLIPIPIDQRYDLKDMHFIVRSISKYV